MSSLTLENYCISHRHKLFDQFTKHSLNTFEPQKPWKYKQLWGLKPDPIIKKILSIIFIISDLLIYGGETQSKKYLSNFG